MRDVGTKLTAKQERAILALLAVGTIREAAAQCATSEGAIFRWLNESAFQSRYRAARRQLVETALAQLQSDCTKAARVLREIAEDTSAPASSRVSAARTILEQSISAIQLTDLQAEVEEIKRMLGEKGLAPSRVA